MSITTLAELETALADRINRSDFTTAQKDECIAFAESEMQRLLKAVDMEVTDNAFSITGEYVALPSGLLFVRDFYIDSNPRTQIKLFAGDLMASGDSGVPQYFEIVAGNFRFYPIPADTYTATLNYRATFTPLSSGATSNWLLTAHPDAYLYGALKHAAIRLKDPGSASGYDSLFQSAMGNINAQASRIRSGGPSPVTRPG